MRTLHITLIICCLFWSPIRAQDTTRLETFAPFAAHCAYRGELWLGIDDQVYVLDTASAQLESRSQGLLNESFIKTLWSNEKNIFCLNGGHVMRFDEKSHQWQDISPDAPSMSYCVLGGNTEYVLTGISSGWFFASPDNGENWVKVPLNRELGTYDCMYDIGSGWLIGGVKSLMLYLKNDLSSNVMKRIEFRKSTMSGVRVITSVRDTLYAYNQRDAIYYSTDGMKWDVYCDLSAPVNLHSLIWDDGLVGLFNGQTAMRFRLMDDPVDLRDKHLVSPFLRREEDIMYITSFGHVKVISGNTSLLIVR